jgi:hypothetical protein
MSKSGTVFPFTLVARKNEFQNCIVAEVVGNAPWLATGFIDAELMPIRYGALLGSKLSRQICDQHRSAQGARFLCRSPATLPEFRHALQLERSNNHQTNFF